MSKESKKQGCFQSCAGALVIGVIALFVIAYCVGSRTELAEPIAVAEPAPHTVIDVQDVSFIGARRLLYIIRIPRRYSKTEVLQIAKWIASTKHTTKDQVNALAFRFYLPGKPIDGSADAVVQWAPLGEWGNAADVETGDYATFRFYLLRWSSPTPRAEVASRSAKPTATSTPPNAATGTIAANATASPTPTLVRTATPVLTVTVAPAVATTSYTVQPGDTLSAIADRYDVDIDDLVAANQIDDPNLLTVGTVLEIPSQSRPTQVTPRPQRTVEPRSRATRHPTRTSRPAENQSSSFPCLSFTDSESMGAHERELSRMDRLAGNPELGSGPDWQRQVTEELAVIERIAENIRNLSWQFDWPTSLHTVRNLAVRAALDVVLAEFWFAEFNRTGLSGDFASGWEALGSASGNVDLAMRALDDIGG